MKKQLFPRFFVISFCFLLAGGRGYANPQGLTVVSGSAHTTQQGSTLQITTSQNALLQWNSFNIAAGETTIFHQPSANSVVIDQINSANPTTIFGSLRANGIVILQNQSGFFFGPNAFVKAGGLVVTTAAINPWGSGGGAGWSFDGPPAAAPIVNYGHLETATGGSLFLIAKQIQNNGTIAAPGGTAALIAGQEVLLSDRPDGLSLSAPVTLPAGSVDNQGRIVANAGQVLLQAQTVNNSGVVQANSVRAKNGVIEFYASDEVQLTGTSVLQANGGGNGTSSGGTITIQSGGSYSDAAGSAISVAGGAQGGNGGSVEISAPNMAAINSTIDGHAAAGSSGGRLLLDPTDIEIGTVTPKNLPGTTLFYNINSAFTGLSQIDLQAPHSISLDANTTWNLATSTQESGPGCQLTLEAGNMPQTVNASGVITDPGSQILLNNGSSIVGGAGWSVTLEAGRNFNYSSSSPNAITLGAGNVVLNGNARVQTADGNINVVAGNNVKVGSGGIVTGIADGAVMTSGGGNVSVQAVGGSVDCSASKGGYSFVQSGEDYVVSSSLGGISTASGGNVTIQAGLDITAALPSGAQTTKSSDYGSGAFGDAPGNVTVTAGRNVTGHFVLANGVGTITAGKDAGILGGDLALSLIKGGWTVNAAESIYLQEVRNPNGVFNSSYVFNYDPQASVTLEAGNGVTILGGTDTALPRLTTSEGLIFPPILTIDAGAGGIMFDASVNLFPSSVGTLNLTTTRGGDLQGAVQPNSVEIAVNLSDSSRVSWGGANSFEDDDPDVNALLHWNDPSPVMINISGSVKDLTLNSSKPMEMYVAHDIIDCAANIQNLRPTDTSSITAGGDIIQHSDFVVVNQLQPGQTPNFAALDQVAVGTIIGPNGLLIGNPNLISDLANIENSFTYDAATRSLLFTGKMTQQQESELLSIGFLDKTDLDYIQQQSQYESSGGPLTYTIAGPGALQVRAATMTLGGGGGIISSGLAGTSAGLAPVTPRGADIDIVVSGDINMTAAGIQSEYGGNISIRCGGAMDIGSPVLGNIVAQDEASGNVFGITSVGGGNISVIADGDVNVDSSRIASYDGGNLFVESLQGNVNAGAGGNGAVLVTRPYVDAQGILHDDHDTIPGSGILATSFPEPVYGQVSGLIGNITVQTPEGSIVASHGGIAQLSLTPGVQNDATINLIAGSKNSDGSVAYVGNVDASGSGVVGGEVNITATGNINGLVVASVSANVSALQNVSATVLSQGGATVTAGGTVSGLDAGGGTVTVSGAKDIATAFSSTGSVNATGAGAATSAPAPSTSPTAPVVNQNNIMTQPEQVASNDTSDSDDPLKQKSRLKEWRGRVTVLLQPN